MDRGSPESSLFIFSRGRSPLREVILIKAFDTPIITNDQSIDRVLAAGLPVLLVFLHGSAPAPLKAVMDRLAGENAGKILVAQVQTPDNPAVTRRYQVTQTPAVAAVRDGQMIAKAEATSPSDLEKYAAYLLGKGPRPEPVRQSPPPQTAGPASSPAGAPGPAGRPQVVTDATFDRDVMRSPLPVLVDFWAPWCGPCRIVEPTVEKLAREYSAKARIFKMNVDENPQISQRFSIMSIPTMMVVKNGRIVDRWVGALPEQALRARVEPLLKT